MSKVKGSMKVCGKDHYRRAYRGEALLSDLETPAESLAVIPAVLPVFPALLLIYNVFATFPADAVTSRPETYFSMKRILFITALAACGSLQALAQNPYPDLHNEFGIGGGVSLMTLPKGVAYTGTEAKISYYGQLMYTRYIDNRFNVGIEAGMTHWETTGSMPLSGRNNMAIGSGSTKYLFADRALNFVLRFNKMHWQTDQFNFQRSYFYYGVAAGLLYTNAPERQLEFAQLNGKRGSENRYISQYNYQNGIGYVAGLQVGYTYFLGRTLGLNIEAAPRFTYVFTEDYQQRNQNDAYHLFYIPVSVGLKFRF